MNIARRSRLARATAAAARCRQPGGLYAGGGGGGGGGQEEALIAAALEQEASRRLLAERERAGRPGGQPGLLLLHRDEEVLGCALLPYREGAPGECDISARHWGRRRGRLPGSACAGAAAAAVTANSLPAPALPRPLPAASMSAKERPKSKVTKESVTLLPCFYFVEVSPPGRGVGLLGGGGGRPGQASFLSLSPLLGDPLAGRSPKQRSDRFPPLPPHPRSFFRVPG